MTTKSFLVRRFSKSACGVFSHVYDNDTGKYLMDFAEHAYQQADGSWQPKVQPGTYVGVLGTHQLKHGGPFQTYEITGIVGHSNILVHVGNWPQIDSDGCALAGTYGVLSGEPAVSGSIAAFRQFLAISGMAPTVEFVFEDSPAGAMSPNQE